MVIKNHDLHLEPPDEVLEDETTQEVVDEVAQPESEEVTVVITLPNKAAARLLYKDMGYTYQDLEGDHKTYSEEDRSILLDAVKQIRDGCINEGKV